jgi:L-iditol 2-dehydrogenase
MWCSSALAQNHAYKWQSTYGIPFRVPRLYDQLTLFSALLSVQTAITGGRVTLIGMGTRNTSLPLSAAALREVDIQGSFRYANTYPEALALLASDKLQHLDKLVTHRFSLSDTAHAFDLLTRGMDERGDMVLKVMIGSGAPPSRH